MNEKYSTSLKWLVIAYLLGCLTVCILKKDRFYKLIPEERMLLERIVYGTDKIEHNAKGKS